MRAPLGALLLTAVLAATTLACDLGSGLTFAPEALPDATVGQPYSVTITVAGNRTPVGDMFAGSGLPPGLSFDYDYGSHSSSGQLTGTPTAAGTFQIIVSAWCLGTNVSGQTGSHAYTLVVR